MTGKRCSHVIITIDGPSGAGKSTAAQCLARLLGYWYVDSGAMYRAVGWLVCERALPLDDVRAIVACLERTPLVLTCCDGTGEVWVDGQCVTRCMQDADCNLCPDGPACVMGYCQETPTP